MTAPSQLFPCPFCRSTLVVFIAAAAAFTHYRCAACAEIWSATTGERDGKRGRPASAFVWTVEKYHS